MPAIIKQIHKAHLVNNAQMALLQRLQVKANVHHVHSGLHPIVRHQHWHVNRVLPDRIAMTYRNRRAVLVQAERMQHRPDR